MHPILVQMISLRDASFIDRQNHLILRIYIRPITIIDIIELIDVVSSTLIGANPTRLSRKRNMQKKKKKNTAYTDWSQQLGQATPHFFNSNRNVRGNNLRRKHDYHGWKRTLKNIVEWENAFCKMFSPIMQLRHNCDKQKYFWNIYKIIKREQRANIQLY